MYLRFRGEKPLIVGTALFKGGGESINELRAPAFAFLPQQDIAANLPIEPYQLVVDRKGGPHLGAVDSVL